MAESNAVEVLDSFFEDWVSDIEYNILQTSAVPEPVEIPERPEPRRRERKAPERKVRIRTLPEQKPVTRTRRDRSKGLFLISAFILLIGALSIVASYSEVYSRKARISALKEEIEETRMSTAADVIRENPMQDMSALYTYAVDELGMQEADSTHTVFITLPQQSYTELPAGPQEQTSRVRFHWFS